MGAGEAGSSEAGTGAAGSSGAASGRRDRPPKPPVDPHEAAREICLHQLSFRPRTRAELATTLHKRGVDDDVAAAVLDRYDEVGLIDDAAFAKAWVATRHHGRGLARRALANELRQRGVDVELVDEALDALDGDTEAATARTLVDRKLRGMGSAPPDAVFRRLVAMLARKGYPAGVAIGTVKEALAARDASAAFASELDVDALADVELGDARDAEGAERWVSD
jgi:regulatory protein